jgi:indole-3-glycerol phosphate synthase
MHKRLKEIIEVKKQEVEILKKEGIRFEIKDLPPVRDFKSALSVPGRVNLIAEIKFASPSAGDIAEYVDPVSIAEVYENAGAKAISLLTDKKFFKGDLKNLPKVKKAVKLPILRKDFIIDEIQLFETSRFGADAALLIVRILSKEQLRHLIKVCRELNLASLVEVHNKDDLEKAIECEADIIGINNRDLDTFEIDLSTTIDIAPLVPDEIVLVSESGINSGSDIMKLKSAGINAVLVGSSLMSSDDPGGQVRQLVKAGIF